ncbi:MAG: hypothetical protein NVV74_00290 [Magnetospirillum sp.]|nr:hypothetical protein [Magnetospirillum sp.]
MVREVNPARNSSGERHVLNETFSATPRSRPAAMAWTTVIDGPAGGPHRVNSLKAEARPTIGIARLTANPASAARREHLVIAFVPLLFRLQLHRGGKPMGCS